MAAHPFSLRFPGVDRAHRYCPDAESAEDTVWLLLRANAPAVEVHYKNRLVATFDQDRMRAHIAAHGVWNEYLGRGKGGWHIPAEHHWHHSITAAVDALGDAPAMPSGKKQKAEVAALVADGMPEDAAIATVRKLRSAK